MLHNKQTMQLTRFLFSAVAISTLMTSCKQPDKAPDFPQEKLSYPATKKVEQVDDYFGTKVADPYRWLEYDTAQDVKQWVEGSTSSSKCA